MEKHKSTALLQMTKSHLYETIRTVLSRFTALILSWLKTRAAAVLEAYDCQFLLKKGEKLNLYVEKLVWISLEIINLNL